MKINSFALFGDHVKWAGNLPAIIRQHHTLYNDSDWQMWIHVDRELSDEGYCKVLKKLHEENLIHIKYVGNSDVLYQQKNNCTMMLWRLLPLWENTNFVFCRDLDSILTPRQLQCVRSFIASDKAVHGIQDNIGHCIPLMGGMCGFNTKKFKEYFNYKSLNDMLLGRYTGLGTTRYGYDQDFLMNCIYPKVRDSLLIHNLSGPNDRSQHKHVTDAYMHDINDIVRNEGDNFTNYIGAVGCQTSRGLYTVEDMVAFYDKNGNKEKCKLISNVENMCK